MKIILTISERIATLAILNTFKGNLETMATILDDIKQLPISNKEWKQANKKETKNGANIHWTWDDSKGPQKGVELQKNTVDYLKNTIKEKDEKKEITFQDKALISLNDKINK